MTLLSNMIESSDYSLQNLDNYYTNLKQSSNIIFLKYIEVINTYNKLFYDTITIQNTNYFKYLFKNGLETIAHIFNNILLYTNNPDLTSYYCQKAYLYYVEFISQIDNVNHSFLQLNGKDASLFAYKKTIFEINAEKKKVFDCKNPVKINNIKLFTRIYNEVIFIQINTDNFKIDKLDAKLDTVCSKINELYIKNNQKEKIETGIPNNKSLKFSKTHKSLEKNNAIILENEQIFHNRLSIIFKFLEYLNLYINLDNNRFIIENNIITLLEALCIKLKKCNIKNIVINQLIFDKISECSPHKFINLIIQE